MKRQKEKKGFALLIATLVSGLFLAISSVIFQIAYVELLLSSVGRDSQLAFYAADSGVDCALYWDGKYGEAGHDGSGSAFNVYDSTGESTGSYEIENTNRYKIERYNPSDPTTLPPINCSGGDLTPTLSGADCRNTDNNSTKYRYCQGDFDPSGVVHWTFIKFPVKDNLGTVTGCVEVVVKKEALDTNGGPLDPVSNPTTKTTIISRGYNTCNTASDRRVERAIEVTRN